MQDVNKIDILNILSNYMRCVLFKIQTYDMIRQKVGWVYYFKINDEYKIQLQKKDYFCLRALGIKEVIV